MQTDILGSVREKPSARELASSKFAVLTLGGNSVTSAAGSSRQPSLVQNANWQYGRQVDTVYEVGSSSIFLNGGRTAGQVGIGRVIGNAGFYSMLNSEAEECGEINGLSVELRGDKCSAPSLTNKRLAFDFGMVTNVTGELGAQNTLISEGVQMLVTGLNRS